MLLFLFLPYLLLPLLGFFLYHQRVIRKFWVANLLGSLLLLLYTIYMGKIGVTVGIIEKPIGPQCAFGDPRVMIPILGIVIGLPAAAIAMVILFIVNSVRKK